MKYGDLISSIRAPVFSKTDVMLAGGKLYDYQLTRWVKKGYLLKLKNGIYAFNKDYEKIKGEEVASALYQPSYLSLESALSSYGFIPEMVYSYVSVTAKINRTFDNKFGHFIYRHVKSELFWGYREVKTDAGRYLIAEPEKALLDYLYLNLSKINSESDFENLRFNEDRLSETLNREKFSRYLQAFKIKKLKRWADRCLP
ncbi:MAG: type IV toxin-antitoxin system AbiEi family antitoxin domain-containing protein [Deltaproteobacteria bacterium]|nr:type IV toxin-antitoxin system AbiEi family antitoxin domain-containing protein [Deltaproteobacteria bacterium]